MRLLKKNNSNLFVRDISRDTTMQLLEKHYKLEFDFSQLFLILKNKNSEKYIQDFMNK